MKTLQEYIVEALGYPEIIKPGLDKFCRTLSQITEEIPVDKIVDILGKTYQDPPIKKESHLRCGTGHFSDDAVWALVTGYLCYDNFGDYTSFLRKPTNAQLDKVKDYIEKEIKKRLGSDKKLWDEYGTIFEVKINDYNSFYQPPDTYGIGVKFRFIDKTPKRLKG